MDAHRNFAYSTVATAPSPAASGTSLTVATGEGARFTAPCNATVWPAGQLPLDTNAEIVRITNVAGDVLTITRAQEGSSARTIIVGDQIANTGTTKVFTDIEDALSLVEVHASAASAAATSVDARVNTISQAVSVISQKVSALSSQVSTVDLHAETASAAATSVDARVNVVSQAVSVISSLVSAVSIAASVADAHASVASLAATSVDSRLNNVSVRTSIGGATSIKGLQSAFNALSNQTSDLETSLRQTSLDLDAKISVLSDKVVSISAQLTSADAKTSVLSDKVVSMSAQFVSLANRLNSVSVQSASGSINGLQSVVNKLSDRISAIIAGGGISVTSAELQTVSNTASIANQSIVNMLSALTARTSTGGATSVKGVQSAIDALSNQVSDVLTSLRQTSLDLDAKISTLSDKVVSISAQLVSIDTHANTASAAATSVDGRVNSVNTALSGLSVLSVGGVSTHGLQSVLNALSNRISATAAGTGSVTSTEVSAVSHNASVNNQSIVDFLSALTVRTSTGGATSVKGLQSALNALSNQASDILTSLRQTSLDLDAKISTLSDKVVSISAQLTSIETHVNTVSGNLQSIAATLSLTNNNTTTAVPGHMVRLDTASAPGFRFFSTTGFEVIGMAQTTIAPSAVGSIQTNGKFTFTSTQVLSITGTTALASGAVYYAIANGAISTAVPAGTGLGVPVAQALDNRTVLLLTPTHLSNVQSALSLLSSRISTLSVTAAGLVSVLSLAVTSVDSRVNSTNTFICTTVSALSDGGVSTEGLQSVINALSNRIALAGAGSVTSNEVSAVSQTASVNNQSLADRISLVSIAMSLISERVISISAQLVSIDARVNSVNTFISGISSRSALSATVSTHGLQSVVNALSNRISINAKAISDIISAGGGGTSVTSNELSTLLAAVSAQAASALSDAISAGSTTASNLLSNINALSTIVSAVVSGASARSFGDVSTHGVQSIFNALSNRISVAVSQVASVDARVGSLSAVFASISARSVGDVSTHAGLQSVVNALSNRISANTSAFTNASTAGSLAAISLMSIQINNTSVAITNASTAGSLAAISLLSIQINTVSAQVASISAQLGTPQLAKVATGSQGVSATAFTNISGLAISLGANNTYQIDGRVIFHVSNVIGTAFGFTYPGSNQTTGVMRMDCLTTVMAAGPTGSIFTSAIYPIGYIQGANLSTVATTNISLTGISGTALMLHIEGLVAATSTGVAQLQVKQSATGGGVFIEPGSFLRAFRII